MRRWPNQNEETLLCPSFYMCCGSSLQQPLKVPDVRDFAFFSFFVFFSFSFSGFSFFFFLAAYFYLILCFPSFLLSFPTFSLPSSFCLLIPASLPFALKSLLTLLPSIDFPLTVPVFWPLFVFTLALFLCLCGPSIIFPLLGFYFPSLGVSSSATGDGIGVPAQRGQHWGWG